MVVSLPFYVLFVLSRFDILLNANIGPVFIAAFTIAPITARRSSRPATPAVPREGAAATSGRLPAHHRPPLVLADHLLAPRAAVARSRSLVVARQSPPPPVAPAVAVPAMLLFFLVLATGEEVGGWDTRTSACAATPGCSLRRCSSASLGRCGTSRSSSSSSTTPVSLFADLLMLVATRVIIVWLFINTGRSVFVASLAHAASNVALVALPEIRAVDPWGSVVWCGVVLVAAAFTVPALRRVGPDSRRDLPSEVAVVGTLGDGLRANEDDADLFGCSMVEVAGLRAG